MYVYHFGLLNHFRLKCDELVNFPLFIMHSLEILINKCKSKVNSVPLQQSVIKLVYEVVLTKKPHRTLERGIRDPFRRSYEIDKVVKKREVEMNAIVIECGEISLRKSSTTTRDEKVVYLLLKIGRKWGNKKKRKRASASKD